MSNNQDETTPQSSLIKEYHDYNKDPNLMGFEFITTEEANALCEEESKNNISSDYKVVSYCIKPSLYGIKYGSKSVAITSHITSTALDLTSSLIASTSYVPDTISKAFEPDKVKDKSSLEYDLTNFTHKLFGSVSSAMYGISYIPYFASRTLNIVCNTANYLDNSLAPETINEICASSNKKIKESIKLISSSLERVSIECEYIKQGLA